MRSAPFTNMGDDMGHKPTLCIDFDGVIHDYLEGWQDGSIYGDVTPGFFEWASEAKQRFKLVIYSSRSKDAAQLEDMRRWLGEKIRDHLDMIACDDLIALADFEFSGVKPPAFLTIDDRCVPFRGSWLAPDLHPNELAAYKTWSQK